MVECLKHRTRLYEKLLFLWNKQEEQNKLSEFAAFGSKYLRKAKSYKISDLTKLNYIRFHLKQETRIYAKNYTKYKQSIKQFYNRESFFWTETPMESIMKLKPSRFSAIKTFTKVVFNNLIKQAQEDEEIARKSKAK